MILCLEYQDGCPKRDACRAVGYCIDHPVETPPERPRSIIALCGPKGSGKSTLAKQLHEHGYVSVNFADPIRAMIRPLLEMAGVGLELIDRIMYGDMKEMPLDTFGGLSFRRAAQTLGTEWREMIDPELWSRIWTQRVSTLTVSRIVVEDMRFLHEYRAVRAQNTNTLCACIRRHGYDTSVHPSEREFLLIPTDVTIYNDVLPKHMLSQLPANFL